MSNLQSLRKEKDHFFATHPQSPLTHEQKSQFTGLEYYPENEDLRLEVEVEEFAETGTLELLTTTGDVLTYTRFGKFKLNVGGRQAELTIYGGHQDYFLPFADSLAGVETYGAGRYLEPHPLGDGRFLVDLNLAYNPYCAYNDHWSCPITPFENRIKIPIRAGEKIPRGEWAKLGYQMEHTAH